MEGSEQDPSRRAMAYNTDTQRENVLVEAATVYICGFREIIAVLSCFFNTGETFVDFLNYKLLFSNFFFIN